MASSSSSQVKDQTVAEHPVAILLAGRWLCFAMSNSKIVEHWVEVVLCACIGGDPFCPDVYLDICLHKLY